MTIPPELPAEMSEYDLSMIESYPDRVKEELKGRLYYNFPLEVWWQMFTLSLRKWLRPRRHTTARLMVEVRFEEFDAGIWMSSYADEPVFRRHVEKFIHESFAKRGLNAELTDLRCSVLGGSAHIVYHLYLADVTVK